MQPKHDAAQLAARARAPRAQWDQCSGLPVACYSAGELADQRGRDWTLIAEDREAHTTPAGLTQPFTWVALRRAR